MFQTQEEEADTDEVEEKKTEEDESEDGKAEVESKDMCERHKDKITAQHSDDLRRVFIPVRYSDSCCSPLLSNKQYPLDFISFHILHHVTFMRGSVKRIEKPEPPGFQMRNIHLKNESQISEN